MYHIPKIVTNKTLISYIKVTITITIAILLIFQVKTFFVKVIHFNIFQR